MNNKKTGALGEALAEIMLVEKGYQILFRNFSCKYGEIDIIARKGGTMAFIEVKTRLSGRYGKGAEAVTAAKMKHIRTCANYYLSITNWGYKDIDFQVIEIEATHLEGLDFGL